MEFTDSASPPKFGQTELMRRREDILNVAITRDETEKVASFKFSPLQDVAEQRNAVVYTLNENDVLSGRGPSSVNYVGNKNFRALIRTKLVEYRSTRQHSVKDRVVVDLMETVRAKGGRFLRRIEGAEERRLGVTSKSSPVWTYTNNDIAVNKCKQTFRDYISKFKNAASSEMKSVHHDQRSIDRYMKKHAAVAVASDINVSGGEEYISSSNKDRQWEWDVVQMSLKMYQRKCFRSRSPKGIAP